MVREAVAPGNATDPSPASFNPARILVLGFVGALIAGTILLSLPVATQTGRAVSVVDALFTATSALCVTGLTVLTTASTWSLFGQVVILALIQAGGLGIMTGSVLVAVLLGKRIGIRDRLVVQQALGDTGTGDVARLFRDIALAVFGIEVLGIVLLFLRWLVEFPAGQAAYLAFFHSISAFNNAGFDLFGSSLMNYASDSVVTFVIAGLIIAGGLGFPVLTDVRRWSQALLRPDFDPQQGTGRRIASIHSRLALTVTAVLLVVTYVAVAAMEWSNPATLGALDMKGKLLAPFLHAASIRTAGFYSLDQAALTPGTLLVTILMMFIGGSPAGTAGGLKTVTLGVLLATVAAIFAGREDVNLLRRRIARDVAMRALAVAVMLLGLVLLSSFLLMVTEGASFHAALFEATSAAGTVGLTLGLTPHLTLGGKLVLVVTMFAGRLGPLTMVYALARRHPRKASVRYSEAKVMVG